MKKHLSTKNLCLCLGMVSTLSLSAADIAFEAESAAELLQWHTDQRNGSDVSGNTCVTFDDVHRENHAIYKFNATEAGTYELDVYYITCNTRWVEVQVNDCIPALLRMDEYTPNWDGNPDGDTPGVAHKTIKVNCVEGENTLVMRGIYGPDEPYTPIIDRFELTKVNDVEIATWSAENRITVECENYTSISGSAGVSNMPAFSGGKGMGFGQSAGEAAYTVSVPREGTYLMTIAYGNMQDRWATVRVNRQTLVQHILFNKNSQGWGNDAGEWLGYRSVIVYLNKGENKITLGQLNSYSPNLDLFTLDNVELSYEMEKPEEETIMYRSGISEIATWYSDYFTNAGLELIRDHNENTVASVKASSASVLLKFPVNVVLSGYAIATDSNTENWIVETSTDGENWVAVAKEFKETVTDAPVSAYVLSSRVSDVAQVRLKMVASGDETISLGDFVLFGNMVTGTDNESFAGVIPIPLATGDYESTHPGFDTDSWHEGIDKLFDGNPDTQFTVAQDGNGGMGDADDIAVTVFLAEDVMVNSYQLSTHNSAGYYKERSPKEWTLEAWSDDEVGYVTVDARSKMNFVAPASTLVMEAANPVLSSTYRLTIKNRRNMATHLSDFRMFADNKVTFGGIGSDDPTGIERIGAAGKAVAVWSTIGKVHIESGEAFGYVVYGIDGRCEASAYAADGVAEMSLPAGIHIVKVGSTVAKLVVK